MSAMDASAGADSYFDLGRPRMPKSPVDYRAGASMLNPANQRDPFAQSGLGAVQSLPTTPTGQPLNPLARPGAYLPPSATMKGFARTPTTTYGPLSPPLPSLPRAPPRRPRISLRGRRACTAKMYATPIFAYIADLYSSGP